MRHGEKRSKRERREKKKSRWEGESICEEEGSQGCVCDRKKPVAKVGYQREVKEKVREKQK